MKMTNGCALALGAALCLLVPACGATHPAEAPLPGLEALRKDGRESTDPERLGFWAMSELVSPGGDPREAEIARKRLAETKQPSMWGDLARGLEAQAHGDPELATTALVSALSQAQGSRDPDAQLVAWVSVSQLRALRGAVAGLWKRNAAVLERLRVQPGSIGWRAHAELVEWSLVETYEAAEVSGKAYDELVVARSGCAKGVRLAGPFGRNAPPDRRRSFAPEKPGPWAPAWPADAARGVIPHQLRVEQPRCLAASTEKVGEGVFYAETFFSTEEPRDLIVAVQGAVAVWVDDTVVLERDLREWGVWQRFGAAIHVPAGRHRVLARLVDDATVVRLLDLDGKPARVTTDADAARSYSLVPPTILPSPNPVEAFVTRRAASGPVESFLAAVIAHTEGMDDVATVLVEPLVKPRDASPYVLDVAGNFARGDQAYPEDVRHVREKELRDRAVARDPKLWYSRAWLALDLAEQRGLVEGVAPMRAVAAEFPREPEVLQGLARLYGRLGWRAERMRALSDLAERFPEDVSSLRAYLAVLDDEGPIEQADAVAARIAKLDPDTEVLLERALARHDWTAARAELERMAKRRPDRKDLAARIANVLARAGDPSAAADHIAKVLAKNPEDQGARFQLADRAYASGDAQALRRALAESLQVGARSDELSSAIDLIEGATDLEPYRMDARQVIADYERWERGGKQMAGIAARVLDYAATWVHADGSSDMLEHEILKIQSQEAINKEAEQQVPQGLVLRVRVIKPDGRTLEPEPVAGKPTLTMPHLEVGDYLEIEHVTSTRGDGEKGRRYRGPHWFFREADKGYWRSEFVVVTPKEKAIEIETRGAVPPPQVRERGPLEERRWRVDLSPPVPDEPDAPRPQEFLPSVRVGWGIHLADAVARLVDMVSDETPLDPRLAKVAEEIVNGVPATDPMERARRAYRAVLDRVQDGQETDGRRVLTGKNGSRQAAFIYLCRLLDIPVELVLAKNRLAMPPLGPMSEVENYDALLLRVGGGEAGVRYLTVRDKFAPFGYVPAEVRGQPAFRLVPGTPKETIPASGSVDGVVFGGRADVRPDGSAAFDLSLRYEGKLAISMRNVLDKVAESQLRDFVETRLLSRNVPAARVRSVTVENGKELDQPLVLHVKGETMQIVKGSGSRSVLQALFPMRLAQIASLPERQTPLLLGSSSHVEVHFDVIVPTSWRLPSSLSPGEARDGDRFVSVKDTVAGHALHLDRVVDVPAGRVQPGAEYARFLRFTQEADTLLDREIVLGPAN
jgi:tetratricopeptide (TPR) repeat protein